MGRLDGKAALITGGSSGLGKGIALGYAHEGARVALTSRQHERAASVADLIERQGGEALPLACDVRDRAQVDAAVSAVEERFGRIDILLNNAGNPMVAPSAELADEQWHLTIATH